MRFFLKVLISLFLLSTLSYAATNSPVGLWQTIDDQSGKPRSLVRINEVNGEYSVVIEKGLLETDQSGAVCSKCTDERKDQPLIGMTIASGLKKNGEQYDGGTILDPDNGKVYKCKMTLNKTGDVLEVRGYIGFSLFGRTQAWKRIE